MIIPEYNRMPRGYGIAYRKYDMDVAVCYPIPFNIFVALFRRAYIWFIRGANLYSDGYDRGYGKGIIEGKDYAFNQYKVMVLRNEIPIIIKNFLERQDNIIKTDNKDITGWILDFIEEEQKRLNT